MIPNVFNHETCSSTPKPVVEVASGCYPPQTAYLHLNLHSPILALFNWSWLKLATVSPWFLLSKYIFHQFKVPATQLVFTAWFNETLLCQHAQDAHCLGNVWQWWKLCNKPGCTNDAETGSKFWIRPMAHPYEIPDVVVEAIIARDHLTNRDKFDRSRPKKVILPDRRWVVQLY